MPTCKKIFIALLGLIYLGQSCTEAEISRPFTIDCPLENSSQYQQNPKSAQFQGLIEEYVRKGLPGVVLLVKDDNGFYIGANGKADIKRGIELQPCHISKVASITKLKLAVAIMRLQEKGILTLDDPITKYLSKDILNKIANGNQHLTVRNLMNHTSGIYDVIEDQEFYLQILNDPSKHWKPEDVLKFTYNKDALFNFNPSTTAGYSNTNYTLLSMIIESATGKAHSSVLHEEIIDLLGLQDTYYFWHEALPEGRVAQGYFDLYNNGTLMNLSNWNTGSGNGYGGIYSTVWDMHLFINALFVNKTLITQSSLNQMLEFHPTIESRKHLGVGCFKDFIDIGDPSTDYAWGHRGRDLSYSADLFYFPEHNATMSLIVNYGTDGESSLRPTFLEMRDAIAKQIVNAP